MKTYKNICEIILNDIADYTWTSKTASDYKLRKIAVI